MPTNRSSATAPSDALLKNQAHELLQRDCVLVIDDEPDLRSLYQTTLQRAHYDVLCAASVSEALAQLSQHPRIACVLSDYRLPDGTGMQIVEHIAQHYPGLPVSLMTAYGSPEHSVQALKSGAYDYLTKPVAIADLRNLVGKMLAYQRSTAGQMPQATVDLIASRLPGQSAAMQSVHQQLSQLAHTTASVVLLGEPGTGKELAARALHLTGDRSSQAFIVVNCNALNTADIEAHLFGLETRATDGETVLKPGAFQQAQGGTLLLDEVGALPQGMQVRLLTALQDRSIVPAGSHQARSCDVRIVVSSAQPLTQLVASGRFRQDLYYRLNVLAVHLPPLRERLGDAVHLAKRWLAAHSVGKTLTLSSSAQAWLNEQPFNGNVRELDNMLERAVTLATANGAKNKAATNPATNPATKVASKSASKAVTIDIEHLHQADTLVLSRASHYQGGEPLSEVPKPHASAAAPQAFRLPMDIQAHLAAIERSIIEQALHQTRYNRTKAGDLLGLNLRQLRYRIEQLGIDC